MLGLDGKKIEKIINGLTISIGNNRTAMRNLEEEEKKIILRKRRLFSLVSDQETKIKILHNALMVSRGVPNDAALLRNTLIGLIHESQRKDILISRKEQLEKEIPELKKKLQKLCKHQFVVGRVSYESHDRYETSWILGYRKCVVCEFGETSTGRHRDNLPSWHEGEDSFPTLNENSERVIDKHGLGDKDILDIWQPLEEVLKHFVDKRVYEIIKT